MSVLPKLDSQFLTDASTMKPVNTNSNSQWLMSNGKGFIAYSVNNSVSINLESGSYDVKWINAKSGELIKAEKLTGASSSTLSSPTNGPVVLWIRGTETGERFSKK